MGFGFKVGGRYSRADVRERIGLPPARLGGDWTTGYVRHGTHYFIFANIGVAGRTGHDYPNRWDGDELIWFGKTYSEAQQPTIVAMTKPDAVIHIFTRSDNSAPFVFAGMGTAIAVDGSKPVRVRWAFPAGPPARP
jgi:5-methylcytosine-specific restriction protein A